MANDQFDDYTAIRALLGKYIEAGARGNSAIMQDIFHRDAVMYGQVDGMLTGGPIANLFNLIDGGPPAPGLQAEITSVTVQETIANASVETRNWNGYRYSDMFILVKDGGVWKILTKVFHIIS